ncbi:recombination-associated protein RdgC [Aquabacterium lacunae]|uniref:Recombination-associated protein RdgC n=1 Tax=Aquabacterium lacunae TaxID=2528630 RepID=A0A4Q9H5Z6_9BURK|nr:recombination-associated protein RdgC [Aquabacterium lacunae]TBO33997.1 recombination-associated protein RdgC [Aquabacterium lacunae]
MFKNLTLYRVGPQWAADLTRTDELLRTCQFVPCGATQQKSFGFVEPRGQAHGPMVESVGGQWLLKLVTEQRVVPGSVVKRRVEELADAVEQQTGRKPGKKLQKELKEQALLELLPMAFTRQSHTLIWLDPRERLLLIDASSLSKADEIASTLVKTLNGEIEMQQLHTAESPSACMAAWLKDGEPPHAFTIDRECELKSSDEQKSVVRYARHRLDTDEVRQHILTGKMPTRLAMTWRDRVSFTLTDTLQIKKLALLDVVMESHKGSARPPKEEAFDADVAIATGELCQLLPELIEALGGEAPLGAGFSAEVASRSKPSSSDTAPGAASAGAEAPASGDAEPAPWD